jgi:hypothetical protein
MYESAKHSETGKEEGEGEVVIAVSTVHTYHRKYKRRLIHNSPNTLYHLST